ncbi:MAG: tRNA pseudouridine(38-40) synthase TruA [Kiritimatiellia bacterium]|jgi:tRNA pseudouridine38-40 synthase|nr:tRNA pseudouridine(38-40) synthase TruA [Kiritimatiellia bacterium]
MQRYRISIAYDGTSYAGWQVQPNAVTVQERIEGAIAEITGESPKIHGSGRTDQGVHARCQVAHFDLHAKTDPGGLRKSLNAILPPDIRLTAAKRVPRDFHARKSVVSKQYRYFIWNADIVPPFLRLYRTHVRNSLDADAMAEAAALLVGRHDFAAFTANPNRVVESTVRSLTELSVAKKGAEIVIKAAAEGFLYKMVRSLAGHLIRVGEGAVAPGETTAILESGKRTARVPTAPPEGLFLWHVQY